MSKRLAVIGCKNFVHRHWVEDLVKRLPHTVTLVSPAMQGPSLFAEEFCKEYGFAKPIVHSLPRGERDKQEFLELVKERNAKVADDTDILVVFSDGTDINSSQIIQLVTKKGGSIFIFSSAFNENQRKRFMEYIEAEVEA